MIRHLVSLFRKVERETVAIHVCAECRAYISAEVWAYMGEPWCISHTLCKKCFAVLYPEDVTL